MKIKIIAASFFLAALLCARMPVASFAAENPAENSGERGGVKQLTFSENIKEHFFLAEEFFGKKDYRSALIEYTNIRQIDPAYIEGYVFPARCYMKMEKYLEACYYSVFTLYLDPPNAEAKKIVEELRGRGVLLEVREDGFKYAVQPGETASAIAFRAYGSSSYLEPLIEKNGGKGDWKEGDRVEVPLDFSPIAGIRKLKKFDGAVLNNDLSRLKEAMVEEKEANVREDDAEGHMKISEEYFAVGSFVRALMAFEKACFIDERLLDRKNPQMITKAGEQVKFYLGRDPKNPKSYFYLAFTQFVEGNYRDALSNFTYSASLGLDAKTMSRSFKYSSLCKKNIKDREAKEIVKESVLKASAEASTPAAQEMTDVMKKSSGASESGEGGEGGKAAPAEAQDASAMTKEQKAYLCYQNRKKIEDAVQAYNENNISEMVCETFSYPKLREQGLLKEEVKCPDAGAYRMNHNNYVECSFHGL